MNVSIETTQGINRINPMFQLRPHQHDAIHGDKQFDGVLPLFKSGRHSRTKLFMACGSGKTATSYGVWEALIEAGLMIEGSITVVFVPSLDLVDQFKDEWKKFNDHAKHKIHFLKVSSSTAKGTDPGRIARFAAQEGMKVIVTTYHSANSIGSAQRLTPFEISLGVFDEAHRTAGNIDKEFGLALHEANLQIKYRLFQTATPRLFGGKPGQLSQIASMDDETLYGKLAYELSFSNAVKLNILVPFKFVIGICEEGSGFTEEQKVANLHKIVEELGLKKGIVFSRFVEQAKGVASSYAVLDPTCYCEALSATSLKSSRRKAIEKLRGPGKTLLANVNLFAEGVDVPSLDYVAIQEPRNSQTQVPQIVGRPMRMSAGKQFGYVIISEIVNSLEDLDDPVWENTKAIIDGLLAHSDELRRSVEIFQSRTSTQEEKNDAVTSFGRHFEIAQISSGNVAHLLDFASTVLTQLYTQDTVSFDARLQEYKEFVSLNGHAPSAAPNSEENERLLGYWALTCRRNHPEIYKLQVEPIAGVTKRNFKRKKTLEKGLHNLNLFIAQHNRLPSTLGPDEERSVARWVIRTNKRDQDFYHQYVASTLAQFSLPTGDATRKGMRKTSKSKT